MVQTLHNEISNLRGGFLPSILSMVSTSKVLHAYVKLSLLTNTWTYKDLVCVNNPSLTLYPFQGILSHHSIAWSWNFQASLSGRGPGSFLCWGYVGGAELIPLIDFDQLTRGLENCESLQNLHSLHPLDEGGPER